MSSRIDMMNSVYNHYDENNRLCRSRHGQLEYMTTMAYVRRHAAPGARVLEIGAGTGRYSVALARDGYDVTAVELVPHNLDVLRHNSHGLPLQAFQGDALDLSRFADGSFDVTLSLGPMYHLYAPQDVHRTLDEAIRVTRPGGVIITAFLSVYAIVASNYLNEQMRDGLAENFTPDWQVRHFEEQVFTGYDVAEFEALFADRPVHHLTTVAADSILELAEKNAAFALSDDAFAAFAAYHLATCEKRELLGASSHLMHICRKA